MEGFNYEAAQLARLSRSEFYRIQIVADHGETKWLSVSARKFERIAAILREEGVRRIDMERARKLDAVLREVAGRTPFEFDDFRASGPIGSELWHGFMGDVLAASHNLRVITMDRRNELMQELYVVWTGDTSSDTE